jgi:Flp pilus assembly protein TadG
MTHIAKILSRDVREKRRVNRWVCTPKAHAEGGSAILELALSLPILLALLVGIAEFGRFGFAAIEASNAAHAGVQYGAQNHATASDNAGMQQAAINDALNLPGLTAAASHFCICSNGSASTCLATDCVGARIVEYVQVNTAATVNPIFKYPGISKTLKLQGQAIMRVEQ